MNDRRSLVEGLKATPKADPEREKDFVFGANGKPANGAVPSSPTSLVVTTPNIPKSPLSTRIRADFVTALKRASLERQLGGVEPNTLQEILEQAIEPWLRDHGYLS